MLAFYPWAGGFDPLSCFWNSWVFLEPYKGPSLRLIQQTQALLAMVNSHLFTVERLLKIIYLPDFSGPQRKKPHYPTVGFLVAVQLPTWDTPWKHDVCTRGLHGRSYGTGHPEVRFLA